MNRCAECGFDWDGDDSAAVIRKAGERYPRPLSRFLAGEDPDTVLRTRPEPGVWSALEYACHTRDMFRFYGDRVERVLTEERPQLSGSDVDELAANYNREDPAAVAAALTAAAVALADRLDGADTAAWDRIGIGSDGDERTIRVLARRAAHEAHHHLLDVGRVLRAVREGST
jgi:hypothetical protein